METERAPSAATLRRATIVALVVAAVVVVTDVMPAEYGIDPTGVGRRVGLTQMGSLKRQLAIEAVEELRADSAAGTPPAKR